VAKKLGGINEMFTGIVQGKGKIIDKRSVGGGMVFAVETDFELTDPEEGESISHNGVCLTVRDISSRQYSVDVSPETLERTNLSKLTPGRLVNLERALRLSDRLGGHLVSGHVDAVSPVLERKPVGDYVVFTLAVPPGLGRYIIEKGSIAIDGVSLTVNCCDEKSFSVALIPHTLKVTTLGQVKKGDPVNLEVDLIGKYVEKLLSTKQTDGTAEQSGINEAFLADKGFLR
jgi:riboflavin synthase